MDKNSTSPWGVSPHNAVVARETSPGECFDVLAFPALSWWDRSKYILLEISFSIFPTVAKPMSLVLFVF